MQMGPRRAAQFMDKAHCVHEGWPGHKRLKLAMNQRECNCLIRHLPDESQALRKA